MRRGKMPSMAVQNGLQLKEINECCNLTELENNLIAQIIIFQYIICLPKSRWAATKKQMISVPVPPETVLDTVQQLPRLPRESGLIPVQLKRKMEYNANHKREYIDPEKIIRALEYYRKCGNPYYKIFDDLESYQSRCNEEDTQGHDFLFGTADECLTAKDKEELDNEEESENEETYNTKDVIRKHQFDHNRNTCLTNNYPEMFTDKNGRQITRKLAFAPAEGNHPTNLLGEKDWDVKSWPGLHPDAKFGLHHKRKVRLTDQQYFGQRILNKDQRFSKSPGYTFAVAA